MDQYQHPPVWLGSTAAHRCVHSTVNLGQLKTSHRIRMQERIPEFYLHRGIRISVSEILSFLLGSRLLVVAGTRQVHRREDVAISELTLVVDRLVRTLIGTQGLFLCQISISGSHLRLSM